MTMTKEDILHLGNLARIRFRDSEVEQFQNEIDAILAYVSDINDIVADTGVTKQVGAVHNVFRADAVTNEPGQYTKEIMQEMPATDGDFMKVKKILSQDE